MFRTLPAALAATMLVAAPALAEKPRMSGLPGKREGESISLSVNVACAPEKAFDMWSSDSGISFLAPAAEIGSQRGDPYTVIFYPDEDPEGRVYGTRGARLLAADPGKFIAFEWIPFSGDASKGDQAAPFASPSQRLPSPLPSWVEISFKSKGSGTRVDFRHYGFADGAPWDNARKWYGREWGRVLDRMKERCAAPAEAAS